MNWRLDVDLVEPQICEKHVQASVKPLRHTESDLYRVAEAFNLASIVHILDALNELKSFAAVRISQLPPHLHRYVAWMEYQASQFRVGKILHQRPEWRLVLHSASLRRQLLQEVESIGPEGQLTNRIGSRIAAILQGEADPLQIMFGDDLLDAYYRELHGTDSIHQLLRAYVDLTSFKRAGLRVLEIGAGTGGTTLAVLEALCPAHEFPRVTEFAYTDVSPGFFEKAKAKLCHHLGLVEFRRLDIEKDPLS